MIGLSSSLELVLIHTDLEIKSKYDSQSLSHVQNLIQDQAVVTLNKWIFYGDIYALIICLLLDIMIQAIYFAIYHYDHRWVWRPACYKYERNVVEGLPGRSKWMLKQGAQ